MSCVTAWAAAATSSATSSCKCLPPRHVPCSTKSRSMYSTRTKVIALAMQSIVETKDHILLVCIAILEALDHLQERLHLPLEVLHELKRKLITMIDGSLVRPVTSPMHHKMSHAQLVGETIARKWQHHENDESRDMRHHVEPEEVAGFVNWLVSMVLWLNHLIRSAARGFCHQVCVLIKNLPGVPIACNLFLQLYDLVEDTLGFGASSSWDCADHVDLASQSTSGKAAAIETRPDTQYFEDPELTAVVLEYREKECVVPWSINRRIQSVMHFQIPLRSFEATVRLPSENSSRRPPHVNTASMTTTNAASPTGRKRRSPHSHLPYPSTGGYAAATSSSPRSIPVSPLARKKVQLAFANFSDDVLYRARDRLRQERAAALTGVNSWQIPQFNGHDAHEEIYLSCGGHCATKVGSGMYRSVRSSLPISANRLVYFEMTLGEWRHPLHDNDAFASMGEPELSVCIGLSTRLMPLNTLVGTWKSSIGYYSSGHVLVGSHSRNVIPVQVKYGYRDTIGVLVFVEQASVRSDSDEDAHTPESAFVDAQVQFCVNSRALCDSQGKTVVLKVPVPSESDLYPTLTLHSQQLPVVGRFSAPDLISPAQVQATFHVQDREVWCLDGLRLGLSSSSSSHSDSSSSSETQEVHVLISK